MRLYLAALFLLSCGAPSEEPKQKEEPLPPREIPVTDADICTVHCERAETCGVVRDACENDCPARGRPIQKMRADFVYYLMLCLEGAACSALKEGTAWKRCHEAIIKTMPVTKPLRKFCFESSRRAAACGRRDEADQMACLTQFRFNSDAALEGAKKCLKEPCPKVPDCMASALIR